MNELDLAAITPYARNTIFSNIFKTKTNRMSHALQPAPAVNDPSPFNVFRPREKIHRPHTRRVSTSFCCELSQ